MYLSDKNAPKKWLDLSLSIRNKNKKQKNWGHIFRIFYDKELSNNLRKVSYFK